MQVIRDFLETLNTTQSIHLTTLDFFKITEFSILFFFENIKLLFFNIFSFQWLKYFVELPIYIPQINESILKEKFFFDNFDTINLYSNNYSLYTNKIFIGFLNGLFLALPCSCSNLIIIRRFLIQGKIAGLVALSGNVLGYVLYLGFILFGIREIIFPFFSIEPIFFFIGLILLLTNIYSMINEKGFKQISLSNKSSLLKIFLLSFSLIWIEQSCIYQFLGNINFGPEPTILEGFFATTQKNFIFIHLSYLFGLIFGIFFFNLLNILILENIIEYIQIQFKILRSSFLISCNFLLLTSILTLSFSSIPYYGLDYLLTSPLGFIPQDKNFQNTFFSDNTVKDSIGMFGYYNVNFDTSSYGRGFYFKDPTLESYEELNYGSEYANFIRRGYIPLFTQYKKQASKFTDFFIQKKSDQPIIKENLNIETQPIKSEDLFKYPTFYLIDTNINPSLYLERRYDWNYKNIKNLTFTVIIERGLNRLYFRDDFFITSPKKLKTIRQKFYSNPIYKFLLNTDIDFFIKRDLNKTTFTDEKNLHIKRLMLCRYNDSLRFYNLLPYASEFQYFFNGTKSFADRVYNQQYKGTLKVVRRLFSISFFSKNTEKENLILKYDQPLFLSENYNTNFYHEEILTRTKNNEIFIESTNQSPFYIGWDEIAKKMILTNRTLPKNQSIFQNRLTQQKNIEFTTWPIQISNVHKKQQLLFDDSNTLKHIKFDILSFFQYFDPYTGISYYKNIPSPIQNILASGVDIFPPNRSGFLWPGTRLN